MFANPNYTITLINILFFLAGLGALVGRWPLWTGLSLVALLDFYLLVLILFVALHGDKPEWLPKIQNITRYTRINRLSALFMISMIYLAILTLFSSMYLACNGITIAGTTEKLTNTGDACYFSLVTLATVGYGDFVPTSHGGARWLVMWEIVNGFLLLLVCVPLAISKLVDRSPED